ncbi:MAG: flagellar basal-body rod protein FlgF [Bacillota bacterium]
MIRSLYSGVSGLRNHQIRMDVIGNNIANVNTTGFKSGRANFQDMVYQLVRSASAPAGTGPGSVNPSQVGTGISISGIGTNMGQGALQNTGRSLDLAIQGNGFFCVTDGTNRYYTRNGIFYIDRYGDIVDSNGNQLTDDGGAPITITGGNGRVGSINIGKNGTITAKDTDGATMTVSGSIALFAFANPEGLQKVGQNYFIETVASGTAQAIANVGTTSEIDSGYLEMSNVDLSEEFTSMIVTQRGYQANARVITVSDTLLQELVDLKR